MNGECTPVLEEIAELALLPTQDVRYIVKSDGGRSYVVRKGLDKIAEIRVAVPQIIPVYNELGAQVKIVPTTQIITDATKLSIRYDPKQGLTLKEILEDPIINEYMGRGFVIVEKSGGGAINITKEGGMYFDDGREVPMHVARIFDSARRQEGIKELKKGYQK